MRISLSAIVLTAGCLLLAFAPAAHAVSLGATKEDVIQELGKPSSTAGRDRREILSYPKGVRITLVDGRVESAQGLALTVSESEDYEPGAAPAGVEPTSSGGEPVDGAEEERAPAAEVDDTPANAADTDQQSAGKAKAAPTLRPENAAAEEHETEDDEDGSSYSEELDALPFAGLALFLGIHFLATLAGLKIAFKVWTMDSLFTGMLAIAAIDVVLHGIFVALGPVTGGFSTMPAVENGIPGLVMIFTIRHFCFNKNLGDAIQTAGVVKVAVALLKMFGAMSLLGSFLD